MRKKKLTAFLGPYGIRAVNGHLVSAAMYDDGQGGGQADPAILPDADQAPHLVVLTALINAILKAQSHGLGITYVLCIIMVPVKEVHLSCWEILPLILNLTLSLKVTSHRHPCQHRQALGSVEGGHHVARKVGRLRCGGAGGALGDVWQQSRG